MRGRYIKGNASDRVPSATIIFDTETTPIRSDGDGTDHHRLTLWCGTYFRTEKGVTRCRTEACGNLYNEFWDWVRSMISTHRPTWIWSHNIGFDLTAVRFWGLWDRGEFVPEFYSLDDCPTIIVGQIGGCKVVFADTCNWLQTSVAKMGDWCKLPKLAMPSDLADDAGMLAYCRRDVEIVERTVQALYQMVRGLSLGCMRYTAASQAFRHWRHMPNRPNVLVPGTSAEPKIARRGYYSGRVEPFFIGRVEGPVYILDVNSMYGYTMSTTKLPCRLKDYSSNPQLKFLDRVMLEPCAVADVTLQTEIPYPVRVDGTGVVYAVGRFCTTLCGQELLDAYQQGAIVGVSAMAYYELDWVCKPFADFWWGQRMRWRREGDALFEAIAKAMPCSLYGKWGQRKNLWVDANNTMPDMRWGSYSQYDPEKNIWHPGRVVAGHCEIDLSRVVVGNPQSSKGERMTVMDHRVCRETEHSFPAISAWITSSARKVMDEYRTVAGDGQVYYQCHDCIHVSELGYQRLDDLGCIDPDLFGGLKLKSKHGEIEYYGVNLLRVDGQLHCSGLPGIHREIEDGICESTTFERLASILSRNPDGTVRIKKQKWQAAAEYKHSVPLKSGWCRPIRLDGDS